MKIDVLTRRHNTLLCQNIRLKKKIGEYEQQTSNKAKEKKLRKCSSNPCVFGEGIHPAKRLTKQKTLKEEYL